MRATDTYEAKVGDTVEGWLCYPTYFPSEGDTGPGPTLFLEAPPSVHHGFACVKKVRVTVLENTPRRK